MTPWLARTAPAPDARLRLFCLPYAGGSAAAYRGWGAALAGVDVRPVLLPGRERRIAEPAYERVEPLVDALATAIRPSLDLPYAIFGHSMGALVGFELARALRGRGAPPPALLVASAHRAPGLPASEPPGSHLPDAELIALLRRLGGPHQAHLDEPDLAALLLPAVRADFALCERYVYRAAPPLACPVLALRGRGDPTVDIEQVRPWGRETTAGFEMRELDGDHFFVHTAARQVTDAIAASVARLPLPTGIQEDDT